jgi:hypothetical protein
MGSENIIILQIYLNENFNQNNLNNDFNFSILVKLMIDC